MVSRPTTPIFTSDTIADRAAPRVRGRAPVPPGTAAGAFVLEAAIASGGFGTVYEARDAGGRRAAIKVLHAEMAASDHVVARFARETDFIRRIRHPNVVDVFEVGRLADGRPYFAMELLEGEDLGALVARRGRLPPAEVLAILGPICDALAAVHARGMIHRDVKPGNVILVQPGPRPVLVDFGVAKLLDVDGGLTASRQAIGTPGYMAPEQVGGDAGIDARADVYALGALAFFLLTGTAPFAHDSPTMLLYLHRHARRQRPSTRAPVPVGVDEVIVRAMRAEPEQRFPDVASLFAALAEACARDAAGAAAGVAGAAGLANEATIGCHLRIAAAEEDGDPEAVADAIACVHAEAAAALGGAGFVLGIDTSRSQLWLRRADAGAGADAGDDAAAMRALVAPLERRGGPLRVSVEVRVGPVGWSGARPVNGTLLELWSWPDREDTMPSADTTEVRR